MGQLGTMALHELGLTKEQEAVNEITNIANKDNDDDILFVQLNLF